eukprot:649315-Karenia_brevis.AAC.1
MDELKGLITGLNFSGPLEPSHTLVDKYVTMQETGALRHIPWQELTTRESEIKGMKVEECFRTDSTGNLKAVTDRKEEPADLSSDTRLRFAMQRRGVALHLAKLMSFKAHDQIVDWYQRELDPDPIPGHVRVSVDQIHRVDVELFTRAAELAREDLSIREDGKYALDDIMKAVSLEPRIQALLFPYRSAVGKREG